MKERCIKIWEWQDAPERYRALSEHGGDEDYVAFLPAGMTRPIWLDVPHFACYDVSEHIIWGDKKDGTGTIFIGAHA